MCDSEISILIRVLCYKLFNVGDSCVSVNIWYADYEVYSYVCDLYCKIVLLMFIKSIQFSKVLAIKTWFSFTIFLFHT